MVDDNLVSAGRRNATERVAMLLMHLYRRAQRVGLERDGWVEFPFNQQHVADAIGLSLVHTNKTLRRLERLGLHKLDGGWLRILEPKGARNPWRLFLNGPCDPLQLDLMGWTAAARRWTGRPLDRQLHAAAGPAGRRLGVRFHTRALAGPCLPAPRMATDRVS